MKNGIQSKIRELFGSPKKEPSTALVLSGGGARGAYQTGVLQYIGQAFPEAAFPILAGVSAGAINTSHLANHHGSLLTATQSLVESWLDLTIEQVFRSESSFNFFRRLLLSDNEGSPEERITSSMAHQRGLVDASPLRGFLAGKLATHDSGTLAGVDENLKKGRLRAFAVTATNYNTGQTTTFVQGSNIDRWVRPNRVGMMTQMTIDHIMASAASPVIFPAVWIDGDWYGDGGVRLTMPLSPAINLGADRILVVSTRYNRTRAEADQPTVQGYPPAAQIIGMQMHAIFLDVLDQDALHLERINALIEHIADKHRNGLRPIKLLLLRPSVDLGKLASDFRPQLSGALRLFTMGIGSDETKSPDWLSMLLFERDYMERLIEIGYNDAAHHHDEIEAFFEEEK